jgi:hypothetical protein
MAPKCYTDLENRATAEALREGPIFEGLLALALSKETTELAQSSILA